MSDIAAYLSALEVPIVDVVGFSFGGRVALSLVTHKPSLVRRLSITGVPFSRPPLGQLILQSWLAMLSSDDNVL